MLLQIREFVLPESRRSLKLYFDNVRNYAVCGVLLAFGLWLQVKWAELPESGRLQFDIGQATLAIGTTELLISIGCVYTACISLLALNALQSWFLLFHPLFVYLVGFDPLVFNTDPKSAKNAADQNLRTVIVACIALGFFSALLVQLSLSALALASLFAVR